jgi:hypothetical protein
MRGSSSTVFCGRNAVQVTPDRPVVPDFEQLSKRLGPLGPVAVNGLVLELTVAEHRLVVFPDGRVLVMGTTDPAEPEPGREYIRLSDAHITYGVSSTEMGIKAVF